MLHSVRSETRSRRYALAFVFVASLAATQYAALYSAIYYVLEPSLQHEEVRINFPYHRYADPELFQDDYITRYLESNNKNYAFKLINLAWAAAFGDVTSLHLYVLPFLLWLIFLAGVYVAAKGMGGLPAAWGALALALSQTNVSYQILSSTPHAFAFPLLAWIVVAMQRRRYWPLMLLIVLSALLYPPCAVIGGLSFAWFLVPTRDEQRLWHLGSWTWGRRIVALAVTGAIAVALAAASLVQSSEFGATIKPNTQVLAYPEAGSQGRYFIGTQKPILYTISSFTEQFHVPIGSESVAKILFLLYVLLCLWFLVAKRNSEERRALWAFCGGALVAGLLGLAFMPALAYRLLYYPLHILFVFAVPLLVVQGVVRLSSATGPIRRHLLLSSAVVTALLSAAMDKGYPGGKAALVIHLKPDQREVLEFVAKMPKDIIVAGWPTGLIESVPYFAKRPAFLLNKTHYPLHTRYVEEMRRRMFALIDAYFGADERALARLRDEWGVDMLIASETRLKDGPGKSDYFEPFDSYLSEMARTDPNKTPYLLTPPPDAVVFRAGDLFVLDLRQL